MAAIACGRETLRNVSPGFMIALPHFPVKIRTNILSYLSEFNIPSPHMLAARALRQ